MKRQLICLLMLALAVGVYGQKRTQAKSVIVNTEKGDTVYSESVTVSTTEDITPRHNALIVNPLKFFFFYNLTYYHSLEPYLTLGTGLQSPTIGGINGFGVNAELRMHPGGKGMSGFYIAPNIAYNYLESNGVESNPFSVGILLGWQWFPGDEFAMGLGIGIDYYIGSIKHNNSFDDYEGKVPALRFDIGYAW